MVKSVVSPSRAIVTASSATASAVAKRPGAVLLMKSTPARTSSAAEPVTARLEQLEQQPHRLHGRVGAHRARGEEQPAHPARPEHRADAVGVALLLAQHGVDAGVG